MITLGIHEYSLVLFVFHMVCAMREETSYASLKPNLFGDDTRKCRENSPDMYKKVVFFSHLRVNWGYDVTGVDICKGIFTRNCTFFRSDNEWRRYYTMQYPERNNDVPFQLFCLERDRLFQCNSGEWSVRWRFVEWRFVR